MSNVLSEEKRQQVIALGRLGWSLRRIEQATGVRRETGSAYLKAAGIVVRAPGAWGRQVPAKPANERHLGASPKGGKQVRAQQSKGHSHFHSAALGHSGMISVSKQSNLDGRK